MVRARVKTKEGHITFDVAEGVSITAKRAVQKREMDKLRYQRARSSYLSKRLRELETAIASGVISTIKSTDKNGTVDSIPVQNPFQIQEQLTTARITASNKTRLESDLKQIITRLEKIERQSSQLAKISKGFTNAIQKEYASRTALLRTAVASKRLRPRDAELRAFALRSKFDDRINEFKRRYQNKMDMLTNQRSMSETELLTIRRQLEEATRASYQIQSLQKKLKR